MGGIMTKLSKTIIILINIMTIFAVAVTIVSLTDSCNKWNNLFNTDNSVALTTYLSEASYYIAPLVMIDLLYFLFIKRRKHSVLPKTEFIKAEIIMIIINILTVIAMILTISVFAYEHAMLQYPTSAPLSTNLIYSVFFIVPLTIIDSLYFLIVKLIRKRREKRNFNLTD